MELSCSNIKKILYFRKGKLLLYLGKWNLLIFPKTEQCTSQPKPQKTKKIDPEKNSLYLWEWNFLALILKKFLKTFSQKKAFLIFPEIKPCTF